MLTGDIVLLVDVPADLIELRRREIACLYVFILHDLDRRIARGNVLPVLGADGERVVEGLLDDPVASLLLLACPDLPLRLAILCCATRDTGSSELGHGGEHINLGYDSLGLTSGLDMIFPPDNKRYSCAALKGAVLVATQRAGGAVTMQHLGSLVEISVVDDGAVVAREDDYGVVIQIELLQGLDDLSHCPVKLYDGIASQSHAALTAEALVGETGNVDVVGGEVHEEWLVLMLANET